MVSHIDQKAEDAAEKARIESKLANFGDNAGRHGPLDAVTVKLPPPRVPRETALRLANLARALPMKPGALCTLGLDVISRIEPGEFFAVIGSLRRTSR